MALFKKVKDERRRLGTLGEEMAEGYLKRNGYKILERNFRCFFGEVDIIAEDRGCIVFVEVKTRKSTSFGLPQDSVNKDKQKRLIRIAHHYLKRKNLYHRSARFDVVSILLSSGSEGINHIRDAFEITSP